MPEKIALITGAAKGIGRSIAQRLHNDGCYCLLVDIDQTAGAELQNEFGNRAAFFACDIGDEGQVKDLFEQVKERYGRLDILVNNAGIIRDNLIWNMPVTDFDLVLDINLKGCWLMCREAATIMKSQRSGRIVNIASRAWLGNPGQTNYSASKAGIIGLTRALALELGRYEILVNAVAPGLIDTPLAQGLSEEVRQKLIQSQPTRNMGKPEDVAQAVAFLCNERTQFITGQTIYVDGGKSIGAGL